MVATYTPNLRLTLQGDNDNPNTWGQVVNQQVTTMLEEAISGVAQVNITGSSNVDLSATTVNGATDSARHAVLELTGTLGANIQLILPAVEKVYLIRAAYTGAFTVNVRPSGAGAGIDFEVGKTSILYTNGTNIYEAVPTDVLRIDNNLSDVANAATARDNLGVEIGVDVQAYDAGLASLASLSTAGFLVQSVANTIVARTIAAGTNVTVTNGDGVAGNPSIAVADASTTTKGVVELATAAETSAGSSSTLAVTPASIAGSTFAPRAFVNFSAVGGTVVVGEQYNIASVVRTSMGQFTITFTTPLANANYVAVTGVEDFGTVTTIAAYMMIDQQTTTQIKVKTLGGTSSYSAYDYAINNIVIFSVN